MKAGRRRHTSASLRPAAHRQRRPCRAGADRRSRQHYVRKQSTGIAAAGRRARDIGIQKAARITEAQLREGKRKAIATRDAAAGDAAGSLRGDGEGRIGEGGAHEVGAGDGAEERGGA